MKNAIKWCSFAFIYLLVLLFLYTERDGSQNELQVQQRRILDLKLRDKACQGVKDISSFTDNELKGESQSVKQRIKQMRGGGENRIFIPLQKNTGDSWNQYLMSFMPFFIFFGILLLVVLFSWICCCCQVLCKSCCNCCQRDLSNPYNEKATKILYVTLGLFLFTCVILSILGTIYNEKLSGSFNYVQCSTYIAFDSFMSGSTANQFYGVKGLSTKLQDISNNLEQNSDTLKSLFSKSSFLETDVPAVGSTIKAIYTKNKDQNTVSPDPTQTAKLIQLDMIQVNILNSRILSKFVMFFYAQTLGPVETPSTITGALMQEHQTQTIVITQSFYNMRNSTTILTNNLQKIRLQFTDSSRKVDSFSSQFTKIDDDSGKRIDDSDKTINTVRYVLLIIFIIILTFSLTGVCSIVSVAIFQKQRYNFCTYGSWFILGFIAVVANLLSAVSIISSIIIVEGCQAFDLFLANETYYRQFMVKGESSDYLYQCLYLNGDIPKMFKFDQNLADIDDLGNDFEDLKRNSTLINSTAYAVDIPLLRISDELSYSEQSTTLETGDGNSADLNSYSNSSDPQTKQNGACATKTTDSIVFFRNNDNCKGQVIQPTEEKINFGSDSCYLIEPDFNIGDRVSLFPTSNTDCTNIASGIQIHYQSLVNYRTSQQQTLEILQTELLNFRTQDTDLYDKFKLLYSDVVINYDQTLKSFVDDINNPETGLINNLNCKFFQQQLMSMNDAFCKHFNVRVFQIAEIIFILSIFLYLGACCLFYSTTRLSYFALQTNEIDENSINRSSYSNDNQSPFNPYSEKVTHTDNQNL